MAFAVHTYSAFGVPPTTELVALPTHEVVHPLVDNAPLKEKLAELALGDVELFSLDITDFAIDLPVGVSTTLDAYAIFPPSFDRRTAADHSTPLLVHVYGEPAGCTVSDSWGGYQYLFHCMMAQVSVETMHD